MMNAKNLIYSMASAARILAKDLGKVFKRVENIKFIGAVVQVTYKTVFGRCSTFLSFNSFKKNFVDRRQEDAKSLKVVDTPKKHQFLVINPVKETRYHCLTFLDSIDCVCEDYRNQILHFKKGCCKHGYAVLNHLGFSNLNEYIESHRWCSS